MKYGGGPVGLSTIAVVVGEEPGTLEDVYEPYLIQEGFLKRTARGREATDLAFTHLGLTPPDRKAGGAGAAGSAPGSAKVPEEGPEPPQKTLF